MFSLPSGLPPLGGASPVWRLFCAEAGGVGRVVNAAVAAVGKNFMVVLVWVKNPWRQCRAWVRKLSRALLKFRERGFLIRALAIANPADWKSALPWERGFSIRALADANRADWKSALPWERGFLIRALADANL